MSAVAQFTRPTEQSGSDIGVCFANAPVGLARCLRQGTLIPLNAAMERILVAWGAPRASLFLPAIVHPKDRAVCEGLFREISEGKRDSFEIEAVTNAGDRAIHWTVWRPVNAGRDWRDMLAVAVEIPVTTQEPRRPQATRLETAGRLVGSVAHDFNNWITGLLLYTDLLLAKIEVGHPARKYAQEIRDASEHATGFVRQLLALTKPTVCQPRLLSLNDIAEGMRKMLLRLIGDNIGLEFELDLKLGLVRIDPTQAEQILLNLVLNARDAMPAGGRIRVRTRSCKLQSLSENAPAFFPCAFLTVEDNGTGMDASTQAHIFEPFFTTKADQGTGLGLATVHDIVSGHGGLIYVDSQPGCGTRVSVLLPIASEPFLRSSAPKDFNPQNGELPSSIKEES
jgi:signal transduction histidine kinase